MRLALALVCALVPAAACLGADKTFPDETDQVVRLHVNAYQQVEGQGARPAVIELTGLGPEGREHAFRARVDLTLDLQENATPEPAYRPVRTWQVDLTPLDFSTPTIARWTLLVPPADMPTDGTYRATARATLADRPLSAEALFAYARP